MDLELIAITVMTLICIAVSAVMTFLPSKVAEFMKTSRLWRGYFHAVNGLNQVDITAERLKIRRQGIIGCVLAGVLMFGLAKRLIAGA